jgi:hypothetical protein
MEAKQCVMTRRSAGRRLRSSVGTAVEARGAGRPDTNNAEHHHRQRSQIVKQRLRAGADRQDAVPHQMQIERAGPDSEERRYCDAEQQRFRPTQPVHAQLHRLTENRQEHGDRDRRRPTWLDATESLSHRAIESGSDRAQEEFCDERRLRGGEAGGQIDEEEQTAAHERTGQRGLPVPAADPRTRVATERSPRRRDGTGIARPGVSSLATLDGQASGSDLNAGCRSSGAAAAADTRTSR